MSQIYIVAGARSPLGAFQGKLSHLTAPELCSITIQETIKRANVSIEDIQQVLIGCVLSAGLKQNPARQAMRLAGMADGTGATTVNKVCGSSMQTVMLADALIKNGQAQLIIAGGMESMSNGPYLLDKARAGYRMGHQKISDHIFVDGLEDAETGLSMGVLAQQMADQRGYSREQMDHLAILSLNRAQDAISQGLFREEIVPVEIKTAKKRDVVENDELPFAANIDKIPLLKPAFKVEGTITAANASSLADGAVALLLASEDMVKAKNLKPLAQIVASTTHSQHPKDFTIAPVGAIESLLTKVGWHIDEVDLWEINEAFALVPLLAIDTLNIDIDKVNIHGGACALGHPLGATGARVILTLIYALKQTGGTKGIAALCIGGGEATAIAIEIV